MPKHQTTHTAYVLRRETSTSGRWLEIGVAKVESDGENGSHHIHIDRLPIGGFGGHILIHPIGSRPPDPQPVPARPGEDEC
jgi:hypothetical protein